MVPVPTFETFWFWFRFLRLKSYGFPVPVPTPYPDHTKIIFQTNFGNFFVFLLSKLFHKEKVYGKMWMKKILNEGNQILKFISRSSSGTVINYGFGSIF